MLKKAFSCVIFIVCVFNTEAQSDTIFTNDTTIFSIRIMNQFEDNLKYSYIKDGVKNFDNISLEKVRKISFEDKKIEVFCDLMTTKKFLSNDVDLSLIHI